VGPLRRGREWLLGAIAARIVTLLLVLHSLLLNLSPHRGEHELVQSQLTLGEDLQDLPQGIIRELLLFE
jgi:hypothetical protein